MIVPALRDIQERYGYLPKEELEFLALRAGLALYQVQEVAGFFPHFRLHPPAKVTLQVCQSMTCHLFGAAELVSAARTEFASPIARGDLSIEAVSCLGRCDQAPVACLESHHSHPRTPEVYIGGLERNGKELFPLLGVALSKENQRLDVADDSQSEHPLWQIDVYDARLGREVHAPYAAVRRCLKENNPKAIIDALNTAGLVGMGGAAARTGKKWEDVRTAPESTKYIVCNGDESEPGTFKDRELLLHAPHLVLEGMLVAGLTLGAQRGYVYIRHEYPRQIEAVREAIRVAGELVPEALERCPLEVFVSPGAYICGEESALLEAMEGRRAQPRNAPPEIRTNGLFDKPTLVNNVETYAWVPSIVLTDEGAWYKKEALRFFSVSGHVRRPGVYEVAIATTLGQLIEQHAGGLLQGCELQAVATSGPSGGFLPRVLQAQELRQTLDRNLPGLQKRDKEVAKRVERFRDRELGSAVQTVDIRNLELDVALFRALELSLGAGIVVYAVEKGRANPGMLGQARNCLAFFAKESCGKCVPCRLGCQQLVQIAAGLQERTPTADDLSRAESRARELAGVMRETSICGLGRVAANPLITYLDHFRHESTM